MNQRETGDLGQGSVGKLLLRLALPTITAQLEPGSVVTLGRNQLDYVVTEYGIAPLRGRSVRQRVENLIAVAHPDFRESLRAQAQALKLW